MSERSAAAMMTVGALTSPRRQAAGGKAIRQAAAADRRVGRELAWFLPMSAALMLAALVRPFDHDEDQYFAASWLVAHHYRPYLDFVYLQTPLQPLITAPLFALADGHLLVAGRLFSACAGSVVIALTWTGARLAGAQPRRARRTVWLMATCAAFLFGAGLFRNDMLPSALLAGAICCLILFHRARDQLPRHYPDYLVAAASGCLLGLATSAKLTFAPFLPAAALLIVSGGSSPRRPAQSLAFFVGGAFAGLAPCWSAWRAAPAAFEYDVLTFARTAPYDWYERIGAHDQLSATGKLAGALVQLASGPGLLALLLVACAFARRVALGLSWVIPQRPTPVRLPEAVSGRQTTRLLDGLVVAGLCAMLLPTPFHRQYILPLLPPLFIRLSLIDWEVSARRPLAAAVLALSLVAGLRTSIENVARAGQAGRLPVTVRSEAAATIGALVRDHRLAGPVATLSPTLILDGGLALDARFAAGVFFYRSGDVVSPARQLMLHAVSPATLRGELARSPPAVVAIGIEGATGLAARLLEQELGRTVGECGYTRVEGPPETLTLYGRPTGRVRC